MPITFGYGTFPCAGHLIACTPAEEHEREEGGKGSGTQQISFYYTRTYAIGICEGPATVVQVKRNGKLVYDITPTSTIPGKSAKFLRNHTFYSGSETQDVDPSLEAYYGAGNVPPFLGTCYMVANDVECPNGAAVDQYEFVVQTCGTVTDTYETRPFFVAALDQDPLAAGTVSRGGTWAEYSDGLTDVLSFISAYHGTAVAIDDNNAAYYSTDNGQTWDAATGLVATDRTYKGIAYGNGRFLALSAGGGVDLNKTFLCTSTNGGVGWSEQELLDVDRPQDIAFGLGKFVIITRAGGGSGIHVSENGSAWTLESTETDLHAVYCDGVSSWMAVGEGGKVFVSDEEAEDWIEMAASTPGVQGFRTLCGHPGYWLAHSAEPDGIFRSDDFGVTWNSVGASASPPLCAASFQGVDVLCDTNNNWFSYDNGLTFTAHNGPAGVTNDIAAIGASPDWYEVPDSEGLYVDEFGELIADLVVVSQEASECGAYLDEIVADLCERVGIDSSEYDVTDLEDIFIRGYRCATESSAAGFIEPLGIGYFFDRGEWDKKLRFIRRGGPTQLSLTVDDLVQRDGPPIEWEQIQEVDLLRKVNVITLDPDSAFAPGKQSWERRASTISAVGESTIEIPIVAPADDTAQIAEKRGKVAWSETDKAKFGLTIKFSKLTPTDIVTLTDRAGKVHTLRLQSTFEDSGVFEMEEAIRNRASTYTSSATGTSNGNDGSITEGIVGPTLFHAMNLRQLRNQDATPGIYIGACGLLSGWPGCQILMSVDGGTSYSVVKTITEATMMGPLVDEISSGGTPLSVRLFGGTPSSKTTAQVAAGANYSAVTTGSTTEVLAYEDVTQTDVRTYDLEVLTRGLEGSTAAAHVWGDMFVDLNTAYFIPIPQDYAGDTLYFKAVGMGLSPDDVDAVAFVYEGWEIVEDGGEI